MTKAVIWGAGNAGKSILFSLPRTVQVTAFVDSDRAKIGKSFCNIPVIGPVDVKTTAFDIIYIANTQGEILKSYLLKECKLGESAIVDVFDRGRLDHRRCVLNTLREEIGRRNLTGSVAEVGVYRGDFAQYINLAFPDRKLILFDTFSGFEAEDLEHDIRSHYSDPQKTLFQDTSIEVVKEKLVFREQADFRVGIFPDSAKGLDEERYCFVSIDLDLYRPIRLALEYFFQKLVPGGYILLHDYATEEFKGVRIALRELVEELKLVYFPVSDSGGSVVIGK